MAEISSFELHPGDPAPEFRLPNVDGKTVALRDFSGSKLLLMVWWCNHCPYVQAWESRMIAIGRRYGALGVSVVAINSNDTSAYPGDRPEAMAVRAREKQYPFPYLFDADQKVGLAYGARVTPHPMLFGADRRLLFQGRIDDNHDNPDKVRHRYLESALDAALAGRPVEPAELPVLGCSVKWRS